MTFRPEPEETKDKANRKKCYLEILGEIFRTEKAAVRPPGLSCIPFPVSCLLRCRKTRPVPYSSGFFNPPVHAMYKKYITKFLDCCHILHTKKRYYRNERYVPIIKENIPDT